GDVPVTRPLMREEVEQEYERHTGLVIVETFRTLRLSAEDVPGVLVANHGPFTWGADPSAAVERARVLEYLARVACLTYRIDADAPGPATCLVDKHCGRQHGTDAYYGPPRGVACAPWCSRCRSFWSDVSHPPTATCCRSSRWWPTS